MLSQVQRLLVYLSFQQQRFLPLLVIEEGRASKTMLMILTILAIMILMVIIRIILMLMTMIMMICRAFHQHLPGPHHLRASGSFT